MGINPLYLVKLGPDGISKEGVVVVEVGKRLIMVFSPLDTTYHVQKRRIRRARVTMATVVAAKIAMGDAE